MWSRMKLFPEVEHQIVQAEKAGFTAAKSRRNITTEDQRKFTIGSERFPKEEALAKVSELQRRYDEELAADRGAEN